MVIDGRFELRGRLGSGGMGTVWRAFDLALEREVALKEVRLTDAGASEVDPEVARTRRERVMREARALARLDHPNVVTIHHIVDSPEMPHPWLVMELVRGESLQERLARGPLSPAEGAAVGRGLLSALRAAHEAGICHRDVKPANVLLRADGTPVLTDFGIAVLQEASRVTVTGGIVGSPEYMAPERLHGHEGDPASDLWSLGLLLYVAVEGTNPLRRSTTAATLGAVMTAQIPPARRAGPLTPVLQALLVREPAARPMADQLDHMLVQATADPGPPPFVPMPRPGTTPAPFPMPMTQPVRPRQRRSCLGAVVAVAVGTVGILVAAALLILPALTEDGEPESFDAEPTKSQYRARRRHQRGQISAHPGRRPRRHQEVRKGVRQQGVRRAHRVRGACLRRRPGGRTTRRLPQLHLRERRGRGGARPSQHRHNKRWRQG
ncbi:serine/threonine protein kinase [Actinomadura sp. BRA 177]|nr:serine/threonine protein kinase [Actinomadura sp. BRA 177]